MSKYELSLSRDYVPSWTHVDAVRELFQNALDQETITKDNAMFFNYDESNETLYIGNKSSVLDVKTLLLGASTKRNDSNTIGQFGEGYKIATLVLTRLNKKVTFYNYGLKEVWNARFVKSRRYKGEEILTFFIDKKYPWIKVPDNNLTITVEGINPHEYEEIVESNLHLQVVGQTIESKYGRILEEQRYKTKVFINGLYVCSYADYTQGYDFKPEYIKIDRDRKLADSFQLKWLSSTMLSGVDSDKTLKLIKDGAADVAYVSTTGTSAWGSDSEVYKSISNKAYESFKDEYGENAIPVSNHDEFTKINSTGKYRPVFVNETYKNAIRNSEYFEDPVHEDMNRQSIKSKMETWLTNHKQSLSKRAIKELQNIINEMVE
ncbi:hypothetical protein F4V43_01675 [Paenibacillus spiritus]|uniref:Uncharacterized protein n=1 Tax=Paenibacillus spiritus TaxID=2496557 RepID=A0A5J5GHM3_9BACL|nr:hypothetical protein [Paenibacillus spiritus]KAA9007222.1 hypothetical protein F4V43_01675 [Paenibacillus spiritus]